MQPSKTFDEDEQLAYISGYNCIPEQANESFLATQKIFGHEPDGVRFYHFVQSFKIGEDISPQEANEIGMELAKIFENREREARNTGSAVGVLVGGAVGFAIGFAEKQTIPAEDVDDGEDEGFEISM